MSESTVETTESRRAETGLSSHSPTIALQSQSFFQKGWVDYALTYATIFGLMVAGMFTFRIASQNFGEIGLSHYAVMRRAMSFILPFLAVGLAVSLSRKVAASRFDSPHINKITYLLSAVALVGLSTFLALAPIFLFPDWVAFAVFGSTDYREYSFALAPMIAGMGLHVVCYAYYQGTHTMKLANLVQAINLAIIPLIAMTIAPNIRTTFIYTGLAITAVSLVTITTQLYTSKEPIGSMKSAIASLVRYGLPRVPGDIAFGALFMLPAAVVTHTCGVPAGGLVAFGIVLLTLAQATVAPISTIILPQATEMLRDGRIGKLRVKVKRLLSASFLVTVLGISIFLFATDFILKTWLGSYAAQLPRISRIIILGAIPLNLHVCMRSIVDAGRERAVNGRNAFIALAFFALAAPVARLFADDVAALPSALVIALCVLATTTSYETWQILRPKSKSSNRPTFCSQQSAA